MGPRRPGSIAINHRTGGMGRPLPPSGAGQGGEGRPCPHQQGDKGWRQVSSSTNFICGTIPGTGRRSSRRSDGAAGQHAENPETQAAPPQLARGQRPARPTRTLIKPRAALGRDRPRFHTARHIERIKRPIGERGGDASALTPFGAGSFEIALLAAGGAIAAVEAVIGGRSTNAYALVRPPGHHAERDRGMGFCLFGNAAMAIMHAQRASASAASRSSTGMSITATARRRCSTTSDDVLTDFAAPGQSVSGELGRACRERRGQGRGLQFNFRCRRLGRRRLSSRPSSAW